MYSIYLIIKILSEEIQDMLMLWLIVMKSFFCRFHIAANLSIQHFKCIYNYTSQKSIYIVLCHKLLESLTHLKLPI